MTSRLRAGLRGVASASVTFAHIYRTQNNQDSGWIEISLDGGMTWDTGLAGHAMLANDPEVVAELVTWLAGSTAE